MHNGASCTQPTNNMPTYQTVADHIKFITGQDNLSAADLLRVLNFAVDWYSDIAMSGDGKWKFDATTTTTNPIATTDIEAGQSQYELDANFLQIDRVEYLSSAGTWSVLTPTDRTDTREPRSTATGSPTEYDYDGNSVYVSPTPDEGREEALRVFYSRPVAYVTELTETIGIPRTHIEALATYGAYQVSLRTNDSNRVSLSNQLTLMERKVREYFSRRDEATESKFLPNVDIRS